MWLWVLIIGLIALGGYLGTSLRDVWLAAKRLGRQAGQLRAVSRALETPADREIEPIGDVYGDPERRERARRDRRRIAQIRAKARQRRLSEATARWDGLTEDNFESIGPNARAKARTWVYGRVDERRL